MYFPHKLVVILLFVGTTHGSDPNVSIASIYTSETSCNDTSLERLDDCWKKLSSVNIHGIPSNPQKIEEACGVFVSGMECVDNWSRSCLSKEGQETIEASIIGAKQMYTFLCTDSKFREDYLKHTTCYQRISPYWDDCNTKFINTLKHIDHAKDTIGLCCIRLRYNQCVNDVTRVLCSEDAKTFLQSITESLMQSPLPAYHSSQCINVDQKNCSSSSSAESSPKFLMISRIPFWNLMLNSIKKLMLAFWSIYHGLEF